VTPVWRVASAAFGHHLGGPGPVQRWKTWLREVRKIEAREDEPPESEADIRVLTPTAG